MLVVDAFLPQPGSAIFQSPEFYRLHASGVTAFFFQWAKKGRGIGSLHCTDSGDGDYLSPRRGTFGGLFIDGAMEPKDVKNMVGGVLDHLRAADAKSFTVALAPEWHDPVAFALQFYSLTSAGFTVSRCDLDFGRHVGGHPFLETVSADVRRRNQNIEAIEVVVASPGTPLFSNAYEFIAANHLAKGYPVSMTLDQLGLMEMTFNGRVRAYGAIYQGALVAAAVCIQIRDDMQHIFLMNSISHDAAFNAVAVVVQAIYEDCQRAAIQKLSYGTSTVGSVVNDGLVKFKRSLGFRESIKLSLALQF